MREAPFQSKRVREGRGRSNISTRCQQMVRTMISEVIAEVRQRTRCDVNNDDYDESTQLGAVDRGAAITFEPDEVVWILWQRAAPADA